MKLPTIPSLLILVSMFATISCKDINEGLSKDAKERSSLRITGEFKQLEKATAQPLGVIAGEQAEVPVLTNSSDVISAEEINTDEVAKYIAELNEKPDPTRADRTLLLR